MRDKKQIIIDGVDVKYYKQLQRTQAQYNQVVAQNKSLQKELKVYQRQEKFPNQCHCAFRCLSNEFCEDAEKAIKAKESELQKWKKKYYSSVTDVKVNLIEENNKLKQELQIRNQECEELKNNLHIANTNHEAAEKECDCYRKAFEEIEEIADISDCAPCLEHDCDCANCEDECTDNGERCMQYGLNKILDIIHSIKEDE